MKNKKILLISTLIFIICIVCTFNVFAHKGRTDGAGGHRDNYNQSGLGSYHYHCGGYPAHLHTNGVCPYKTTSSYTSTSSDKYDEGYDDGYDEGYDEGYDVGFDKGYDAGEENGHPKGYDKGYDIGYNDGKLEQKESTTKKLWFYIPAISIIILYLGYKAFFSKSN